MWNRKHQFFFISGLPRTGSTVLSAVLSQNPKVHSDVASPVCQIMRDMAVSFSEPALIEMGVANRPDFQHEIIGNIPDLYYKNVDKPFVVDKCRDWTHFRNMDLIRFYISPNPKVLVLLRDKKAIMDSFRKLWKQNGISEDELKEYEATTKWQIDYYCDHVLPTVKANNLEGHLNANEFMFIEYEDFMSDPSKTMKQIYSFFEWESFIHNFTNIEPVSIENDSVLGIFNTGLHEVRPVLESRN
tara:strand:- start:803 stop:1531 length:729 start_codon:yes stop_codon:yes gene_type:complete